MAFAAKVASFFCKILYNSEKRRESFVRQIQTIKTFLLVIRNSRSCHVSSGIEQNQFLICTSRNIFSTLFAPVLIAGFLYYLLNPIVVFLMKTTKIKKNLRCDFSFTLISSSYCPNSRKRDSKSDQPNFTTCRKYSYFC